MAQVKVVNAKLHVDGVWHNPGDTLELDGHPLANLLRDQRIELVPPPEVAPENLNPENKPAESEPKQEEK